MNLSRKTTYVDEEVVDVLIEREEEFRKERFVFNGSEDL